MRRVFLLGCSAAICLLAAAPCLAQSSGDDAPTKSYVGSYFIVGLGIALGLVAVCRPSKRRKDVKRPE